MANIHYHKLIRDRIPEIIEKSGKTCLWKTLSDEEYVEMLDKKLDEELKEYQQSKDLEELADLLEVIFAVAAARGSSVQELENIRLKKRLCRGGFDEKKLLLEVHE